PNTSAARVAAAADASTGFLYVVPLLGVTGARDAVASGAAELIASVRSIAAGRVPVAAGFGLGTPAQVAALAPSADGLIIGSALVAAMRDGGAERMGVLVRSLASATLLS
ncbi:MAG: tryptophan synthase subunit alpha, partial [Candidatus Limnocylindria bacterium]